MRFVAGRGAIGKKLAGKSAQKPRFCARKARKWGSRRAKAHKNPDFVLEMPENGGPKGKKRTKTQILCSKCPKMGVSKAKSAQKPRFCARNARKRGFRRAKAHKNADFVLGRSAESGTLPRGTWRWVASARHQAPRRCCRNGGAAAVLPKW